MLGHFSPDGASLCSDIAERDLRLGEHATGYTPWSKLSDPGYHSKALVLSHCNLVLSWWRGESQLFHPDHRADPLSPITASPTLAEEKFGGMFQGGTHIATATNRAESSQS